MTAPGWATSSLFFWKRSIFVDSISHPWLGCFVASSTRETGTQTVRSIRNETSPVAVVHLQAGDGKGSMRLCSLWKWSSGWSFPTCQVRFVRLYVSLPASSFLLPRSSAPRRTSAASSGSQCSPPRDQSAPGPQPRDPEQSIPRRTSATKNLQRYTR